jgi:hypothetical protein
MQSKARFRDADILGGQHSDTHHIDFEKVVVYDNLMYNQLCLTDYCYRGDFEFVHGKVQDTDKLREQIEKADIINGIGRHIEYRSEASVAYDNGADCAATIGWGWWEGALRSRY